MSKQIAIIGLGRFGQAVARELLRLGHDVVGMELSEKIAGKAMRFISNVLILDSTNEQALRDADIAGFDIVVVAIGASQQASILTTLLLKELGARNIIAKALDEYHKIILQRVGADRVIEPEAEMGLRLARTIVSPNMLDFMELGSGYSVAEIMAPPEMHGHTLIELDLRRKHGINVLATKRDDVVNAVLKGDFPITANDILIVIGLDKNIDELRQK